MHRTDREPDAARGRRPQGGAPLAPRRSARSALPRLLALLALLLAPPALAQAGLYGPEAPSGAAFVRFVNAVPGDPIEPRLGGEALPPLPFGEVSPYRALEPGPHAVEVRGAETGLTFEPETFTTVGVLRDSVVLIGDPALRDVSRGLLGLVNLTSAPMTLETADGRVVVEGVRPGFADAVPVAEAEVGLVVRDAEGAEVGRIEPRLFERGVAHAVFVLPRGSDPAIVVASSSAAP